MDAKKKSQKDGERSFLNKSYKVNIKKISLLILGKKKLKGSLEAKEKEEEMKCIFIHLKTLHPAICLK